MKFFYFNVGMFAKACICFSEIPIAFMMMFPANLLWLHVHVLGVLCCGRYGGLTLFALAPCTYSMFSGKILYFVISFYAQLGGHYCNQVWGESTYLRII